jgi:hypothetical protein
VLAEAAVHIASELVRREDFSKITAILDRVAEGQDQLTESQQRLTEGQERLAAALEQLSWTVSDVKKHLGGLGQTAGYADEAYVLERLPKLLSRRFGFIETSAMPETFTHPDGSTDEIDVTVRGTLDGRPVAFIGETKANITLREVEDFLKVVGRVRPAMQCDDVRAIFFAYRASGDARQAVAAVGCSLAFPHDIIVQPG